MAGKLSTSPAEDHSQLGTNTPETNNPVEEKPALPYRHYTLGLLLLVYILNFLDRQLLSILLEPIKEEFSLSDTQLGLLGGIAFAIFYVTCGLPIGRLADRTNRVNILSVSMALWSLMTALCGAAGSFTTLLLARIGVAVGEAGGSPPSHSIISDLYPADKRATALSVYSLGIPLGTLLALAGGGWIEENYDWRTAFYILGVPGILYAALLKFIVREPPRGYHSPKVSAEIPDIKTTFRFMLGQKSFVQLSIAAGLHALSGYGVGLYLPSFFRRVHDVSSSEAGLIVGLMSGIAGGIATFAGGYIADKLAKRYDNPKWYLWIPALSSIAASPFMIVAYLSDSLYMAIGLYIIPSLVAAMYLGPTFTLGQNLSGIRMRALASSILLFILNLIGLGLGPLLTGIFSDLFHTQLGMTKGESLTWALVIMALVYLWSALHYFLATKTLKKDLETAKALG